MLLLAFTVFVSNPNFGRARLVRSQPTRLPSRLCIESPLNSCRTMFVVKYVDCFIYDFVNGPLSLAFLTYPKHDIPCNYR